MALKIKKSQQNDVSGFLEAVLDIEDLEVIVVRDRGCKILFANKKAKLRLDIDGVDSDSCKSSYAQEFSPLCENCPRGGHKTKSELDSAGSYEVISKSGQAFNATYKEIEWFNGKPATIIYLQDISKDKEIISSLYSLAYVDQLTQIPNRQKLREDFTAIEEKIEQKKTTGVIALFDIDDFKKVNDMYGHGTGDVILRRMVEHFQADKSFGNHIYRLGGDEFVLFYTEDADKFSSFDERKAYYEELLSGALQTFTLPNISLKCSLSIGVSFFPEHGTKFSELVRKADIAMYKAKANGRNRIVLFEDRYFIAEKFNDFFINIKPVLLFDGTTFGYELSDGERMEAEQEDTVSLREINRALDALELGEINSMNHYFITYTNQLMNPTVLENLDREKFIVKLPVSDDISDNDIRKYEQLREKGYKLAAREVKSIHENKKLLKLADYCVFDFIRTNPSVYLPILKAYPNITYIATGIDTPYDLKAAKSAGFQLYQGFCFSQPTVFKKKKTLDPLKANYMRLLKLSLTDNYLDFSEISAIISVDVSLTYRLLKMLNSAAVGLRNVSNIPMAVVYMGEENLKKWIAVLALRGVAEDKPMELVRMSLIRARFGELLAPHFRKKRNSKSVFMVGMLSLLHIAIDKTKQEMLESLPVAEEVRESLLTKVGPHSDLLRFFEHFEYTNWDEVSRFVSESQLDFQFVSDSYIASIKWYNELVANSPLAVNNPIGTTEH